MNCRGSIVMGGILAVVIALGLGVMGSAPEARASRGLDEPVTAVAPDLSWENRVDFFVKDHLVTPLATVFFFDVLFGYGPTDGNGEPVKFPLVVFVLIVGAFFLTLRMRFINIRGFRHAIDLVRGKYDDPDNKGEVSHFQALTAALSATVGLGNIAGVALAIGIGGPGATFWMIVGGFLGMASKFVECTLGQKYREIRADGHVMGGGMYYLSKGFANKGHGLVGKGFTVVGKGLAVLFAVLCVGGAIAAGCAFQVNQSMAAVRDQIPWLEGNEWVYGIVMMVAAGLVIIGGIKRIALVAEAVVPAMVGLYVAGCLWIIGTHIAEIPDAFRAIVAGAFASDAMYGGFVGVLIMGLKRASFSNEAGLGSAAIAHSAARVKYPVEEGLVALLEPFIDTIVVCTMSALVIIVTGAYDGSDPENAALIARQAGAALMAHAMGGEVWWFPYLLSVAVILFAYSTMISWSYYGERCWSWLFGERFAIVFRLLFIATAMVAAVTTPKNILDFGDLLLLAMAVPNIPGIMLLSGEVKRDLDEYLAKLKAGELVRQS